MAHIVKNLPAMWENWVQSLGWEDPLEMKWQPTPVFLITTELYSSFISF